MLSLSGLGLYVSRYEWKVSIVKARFVSDIVGRDLNARLGRSSDGGLAMSEIETCGWRYHLPSFALVLSPTTVMERRVENPGFDGIKALHITRCLVTSVGS